MKAKMHQKKYLKLSKIYQFLQGLKKLFIMYEKFIYKTKLKY